MSGELLISHCSPTLAGIKTANLFSCKYESVDEMRQDIRDLNRVLGKKGIRVLPLRFVNHVALIYVYRPGCLSADLKQTEVQGLLRDLGYSGDLPERYLVRLIQRLNSESEFPHEIGVFLGYPPEDVLGFIENKAGGYKLMGPWKVYGDEEEAKRRFESYRRCTKLYREQYRMGKSIEWLTAAI